MAAKFLKGDRVKFLASFRRMFRNHTRLGTVTSDQRQPEYVNVRPDGHKASSSFHVNFVERVRE